MLSKELLQSRAAFDERQGAQILVGLAQEIERDKRRRLFVRTLDRLRRSISGDRDVDTALKALETRRLSLGVERNDLAVEDDGRFEVAAPGGEGVHQLGELGGLLVAEARPESHTRARCCRLDERNRADAVVLRLVEQIVADERRIDAGKVASIGRSVEATNIGDQIDCSDR